VVGVVQQLAGDADEVAQSGVVRDDAGVVERADGAGDLVGEAHEVFLAPHLAQGLPASQGLDELDDIQRSSGVVECAHRLVDRRVCRPEEPRAVLDDRHDVGDHARIDQHRAQQRHLGLDRVWREPVEQLVQHRSIPPRAPLRRSPRASPR